MVFIVSSVLKFNSLFRRLCEETIDARLCIIAGIFRSIFNENEQMRAYISPESPLLIIFVTSAIILCNYYKTLQVYNKIVLRETYDIRNRTTTTTGSRDDVQTIPK